MVCPARLPKTVVAAYVVNVVDEAERLKDSKGLRRPRRQKGSTRINILLKGIGRAFNVD